MDSKPQIRKPQAGKSQTGKSRPVKHPAAKSAVGDYLPALGIGALIVVLAFVVPWFLKVEPSTSEQITQDSLNSFRNDCISLILRSGEVLPACASLDAITATYHVDALALLIREQGRMVSTAQKIARGDITNESELKQCLKSGECVKVPGLNFDIDIKTASGKAARAEFWHLVNDGHITQANCDSMDICRAMVKAGLMPQPPALAP